MTKKRRVKVEKGIKAKGNTFGKRHKITFGMRWAMNTQSEKGLKTQGLKQSKDAADTYKGRQPPGPHSHVHLESSGMNRDAFRKGKELRGK